MVDDITNAKANPHVEALRIAFGAVVVAHGREAAAAICVKYGAPAGKGHPWRHTKNVAAATRELEALAMKPSTLPKPPKQAFDDKTKRRAVASSPMLDNVRKTLTTPVRTQAQAPKTFADLNVDDIWARFNDRSSCRDVYTGD